ncbi:MAG: choice-of-anchor L domain-containing protein [Chitinophagaceae bacterium]
MPALSQVNLDAVAGALVTPTSGVTITGVQYSGRVEAIGTFVGSTTGTIGLSKGIILSTGKISDAGGPNDISSSEGTSFGGSGDATLSSILNTNTYDAAVLQFQFTATGNKVKFNYVFASEEYGKFVCSTVNDGFGFFVSGPGISGVQNIAQVKDPSSNQYYPVSINRVNNGTPGSEGTIANCQQPIITGAFNASSLTSGMQSTVQYDGYTKVLTAELTVVPCSTYTIRIVIADAYDGKFDSGVLIEAGSFSLDPVSITSSGANTGVICEGSNKVLSMPAGYTSYQWKKNTVDISGATDNTYTATLAGDYSVAFKRNSCGLQEQTPVLKLSVTPLPVKTVTASKTSVCTGAATLTSDQGTGTYLWSPGNQTTKSISVTTAGSYSVTVTSGGCSAISDPVVITDNTLTLSGTPNNISCNGAGDGSVSITAGGGKEPYTVNWTGPAGALSSHALNLTGLTAGGTYTATVTDANGCVKTQSATISNPAVLSGTATAAGTGSVQVSVSGGTLPYSYSWKTSAGIEVGTTAELTGLAAGAYTVTVTDSRGCTVTKTATVTSGCGLVLNTQVTDAVCPGTASGSAVLTVTGGSGTYTYSWSQSGTAVSTSKDLSNAAAGVYKIEVTDPSNGCRQGVFAEIKERVFTVEVSGSGEKCFGSANGSVHSQVTGGAAPLAYSWKNSSGQQVGTTADVGNLATGSYTVTVTDANNCSVSKTTGVGGAGALEVTLVKQDISCNGKGDGKTDMTIHGGTFPYVIQWSGPSGFSSTSEDLNNLAAGTYTVTVTDANQCISTITSGGSITIIEPGILTASAVQGTVRGSANLTVSGGTEPYTYVWSNGISQQNPDNLLDGQTYSVAVTDAHGCTANASVKMSNGCKLSAREITHLDVACNGLATGSVVLGISGGNGNYTYSWKNNQGTEVSTLGNPATLTAGSYIVTITDPADGCHITYQTTISQPSALVLTSSKTDISCHGLTDGSVTATFSGGSTPYQGYSWKKNGTAFSTSQNLTGLGSGSYEFTVTDAKGCNAVSTQTIIDPAVLQATAQATAAQCFQGNSGQIALTVTGGWQAYTYTWTAASSYVSNYSSAEGSISNLYAGSYHVVVKDARNCQTSADAVITEPSSGVTVSIQSQINATCYGGNDGSVQINVTGGTGPYTYVWKQFGNALASNSTIKNQSGLKAGVYTVTATDSKGCSKDQSVTITEPSGPVITYTDNLSFCEGLSAQLHATTGYTTYQWLLNGTAIATGGTTANYTATLAGKYTVRVTRSNSSCIETSKEVYITVNPKPTVTIQIEGNRTEFCEGSSLTLNSSFQGTAYSWKKNGTEINTASSITVTESGTYTLTTKTRLCDNITAQVNVTKYPNFTLTASSTPAGCPGAATGSVTATATGAQAPVNYDWAHLAPSSDPAALSNVAAGSYSVLATDRVGCMRTGIVQVAEPTLTVQPTLTQINCSGGNTGKIALQVSYTPVNGTGTGTANCYSGSGPGIDCTGGFNITGSNWVDISGKPKITIAAGQTFSGGFNSLTAGQTLVICGTYNAASINLSGGTVIILGSLQSSGSVNLGNNVLIKNYGTMTVTDINSAAGCSLENYGSLTVTGNINNPISLSNYAQMTVSNTLGMNGSSSLVNNCTLQVNGDMNVNSAVTNNGSITVTKKLTINGGGSYTAGAGSVTQAKDFTFNSGSIAAPSASAVQIKVSGVSTIYSNAITGKLDICDANGIETLTVSLPASVTTNCSASGGGTVSCATTWSNNATGNTISTLTAGSYTATIKCGGCTNTYTYQITQPDAISITTQSLPISCFGQSNGSIQASVTGGTAPYSYSWSNGASSASLSNLNAGSYTLTVTDAKSCSKSGSPVVLAAPAELIATVTSQAASCKGNSDGTATAQVTGGTAPYTYVWSANNQTGSTATGLSKGIATVTVTDNRGCSVQGHTSVSELDKSCNNCPGFSATVRGVNTSCITGTDGSVYVTVNGGRAPYTFQWQNQSTTGGSSLSGLSAGSYTVTVRDQDNCIYSGSAAVSAGTAICPVKCNLVVSLHAVSPNCPAGTGSIQSTVTGGSGSYVYKWNDNTDNNQPANLSSLKAGTYSLQVRDGQISNCTFTSTVQITIPGALDVFASANQICPGQILTLTSSYPSGNSWSTGAATRSIDVTAAGSYTLTVAGSNGCAAQSKTIDIAAGDCSKSPNPICGAEAGKTIVIENTCQSDQISIATDNAAYSYEQYLDAVKKDFQERYIAKCLNAYENFTLDYQDKEHHRTLYYYDQAGNLVRTIPPEGVNLITSDKLGTVKQDRANNVRTVFTDHGYATTYTYNSLNQLVAQNMPDHNTMAISDKQQSSTGLPAGLDVTGTQFTGNGNGFLTANDPVTGNGQIYFTKDAGRTWQPLGAIGTMTLNDVQLIGTTAYAIGNEGTLLKSTDGGASWIVRPVGTTAALKWMNFGSAAAGIIYQNDGTALATTNGGDTWSAVTGSNTLASLVSGAGLTLTDIYFNSATEAYATLNNTAAGSGYIAKSSDGGVSWFAETGLRSVDLNAVHMLSAGTGYAAGVDGTLLKTTNSGTGWQQIPTGQTAAFDWIRFRTDNANEGVALQGTSLVSTLDGGKTWAGVAGNIKALEIAADNTGYYVQQNNTLFYTGNGGFSWTLKVLPASLNLTAVGHSGQNAYVGTANGELWASANVNNLTSWKRIATASIPNIATTNIKTIHVRSQSSITVELADGSLYTSTNADQFNAGNSTATWTASAGLSSGVKTISYTTADKGYALTTGNTIFTTTNGGESWSAVTTLAANTAAVSGTDDTHLVGVGANGTIYSQGGSTAFTDNSTKITAVALSGVAAAGTTATAVGTDGRVYSTGGSGWKQQLTANRAQLSDVAQGGTGAVAVGTGGTILYSTTGNSWTPSAAGATENIRTVSLSGTDYYAAADNGILLKSATGGSSWIPVTSGTAANLKALAFGSTGTTGIGVGSMGTIIRTTTGTSWAPVANTESKQLYASVMVDNTTGFAVGRNGVVIKTTTGGDTWSNLNAGTNKNLRAVDFSDLTHGIVAGDNGTLKRTENGGLDNFNKAVSISANNITFTDVQLVNANLAFAVGYTGSNAGVVYQSNNGGQSWTLVPLTITNKLNAVYFVDASMGFVVGDNGTVYKATQTTGTTYTWAKITDTDFDGKTVSDVHFVDYKTGYVIGDNGLILKTTEGGLTNTWGSENLLATTNDLKNITVKDRTDLVFSGTGSNVTNVHDETDLYSGKFWYDELGRLIISQNAKQYNYSPKGYSYTLYDPLGRIMEVGEVTTSTSVTSYTSNNNSNQIKTEDMLSWLASGTKREITRTFYDVVKYPVAGFTQERLRNRVSSVSYQKTEGAVYDHATHYSYDIHGNVKSLIQDMPALASLATPQQYKRIDYDYDLVSGNVNQVIYQANKPDQFMHRYAYDADNRITQVETSSDGVLWDKDAKYFYYDHGPLARTETGDLKVQGMDYAYTLQGWIKGVNSNTLATTTDIGSDGLTGSLNAKVGSDAFGYSINYFVNDYKAIATLAPANNFIAGTTNLTTLLGSGNDGKSLYNGNITSMVTTIIDPDNIATPLPQLTTYKYDQLNRITKLDAYRNINLATNSWTSAATDNAYQERYSYDANGNIKTLARNGNLATSLEMDRFEYHYEGPAVDVSFRKKNNRLSWVTDNGSATGAYTTDLESQGTKNYSYDEIGNLTKDNQEEIAEIKWNVYGKVSEVIRTEASNKPNLEFRYDAAGNRIMKIVKPKNSLANPAGWTKTYYVRDAGGNVMSTYEEVPTINTGHYSLAEQHIYGSSRAGIRSIQKDLVSLDIPTPNTYARILGEKRYEAGNHLGNVLAVFSDRRKGVDFSKPNLLQSSDYYAFGMAMPGRTLGNTSNGYRYGFNGKEHEEDIANGGYDFGARLYNSRTGRWLAVDPSTSDTQMRLRIWQWVVIQFILLILVEVF